MDLKISVVIPTIGRKNDLILTLESLLKQVRLPDEIIVVDQNQPPFEEVVAFLKTIPFAKHIKNTEPGLCRNYNRCWQEASGDVVLFVDDDIQADPNLVDQHLRRFEEDAQVGCVAGRVLTPSGKRSESKTVGHYRRVTGDVVANFDSPIRVDNVDLAQGCNMSFRRRVLADVGGFDESFTGNAYFFEPDACMRVKNRGWKIVFEPRAVLLHLMAARGGARVSDKALHTYYFIRNGIKLYRRHSPRSLLPFFVMKQFVYGGLKAAYNGNPKILQKSVRAILDSLSQSS